MEQECIRKYKMGQTQTKVLDHLRMHVYFHELLALYGLPRRLNCQKFHEDLQPDNYISTKSLRNNLSDPVEVPLV
jgi:hypothetical protein